MKKYLPFVFPALALAIVIFLGYRWYTAQTTKTEGRITDFAEGVEVNQLSQAQLDKLKPSGAKDVPSVALIGEGENLGQVRYELADGQVAFTVNADLPAPQKGEFYQVWLKAVDRDDKTRVFKLELGKAGYMGWGSVSAETLPFQVVVSKETKDDDQLEMTVLSGTLQK